MDMDDICVVDRQSWICLVEEPCVVCVKDTPPYFLNFDTEGLYRLIYMTMYQNYWWTQTSSECEEQGGGGLPFSSFSPLWFSLFKEPSWGWVLYDQQYKLLH